MLGKDCAVNPTTRYPGYFEYHRNGRVDIRAPRCGIDCTSCEQNELKSFNHSDSVSVSLGVTCETLESSPKLPEDGLRDFRNSTISVRKIKSEYAMKLERKEKENKFTEHPRDDGFGRPEMRHRLILRFRTKRGRERYRKMVASKLSGNS
jgi:hypothetical protein